MKYYDLSRFDCTYIYIIYNIICPLGDNMGKYEIYNEIQHAFQSLFWGCGEVCGQTLACKRTNFEWGFRQQTWKGYFCNTSTNHVAGIEWDV